MITAATRLFQARGFEQTTVDDIADAVDVSRATFFRYFRSKDEVLLGDHQEYMRVFSKVAASKRADESVFAVIRRAAIAVAEWAERISDDLLPRYRIVMAIPELHAKDRMLDKDWYDAMRFLYSADGGSPLRARLRAGATVGTMRMAIEAWADCNGARTLPELIGEAFDLIAAGIE